jgi:hypothetical protein
MPASWADSDFDPDDPPEEVAACLAERSALPVPRTEPPEPYSGSGQVRDEAFMATRPFFLYGLPAH